MAGKKKKADLAAEFFGRLVAATESGEEDVVKAMLKEAKKGGLPISLHEEVNEVNWDEDYPLVKVNYELRLGAIAVAKWYSDYSGHWGGGGTGWWVEEIDSDLPLEIRDLMEMAGIDREAPDVPSERDDEQEEEEDRDADDDEEQVAR